MTVNHIINYVLETPENINPAILRQLLRELAENGDTGDFQPIPTAKEECATYANYFATNVYNKKGSHQTLNRENDSDVASNYFVAVAENVSDKIKVIVDSKLVSIDDTFKLSIGNNSFVHENYYYLDNGTLYVAFPILLLESVKLEDVIINNSSVSNLVITGTKVVGEGTIQGSHGNYIAKITKRNSYLDFGLQDVEANDIILSKKIRDGVLSYGFIKADEQVDGVPGIGYVPFIWATTEEAWTSQADISITEYTLFSPKLSAKTSLHVESRKGAAIDDDDEEIIYDGGSVNG